MINDYVDTFLSSYDNVMTYMHYAYPNFDFQKLKLRNKLNSQINNFIQIIAKLAS